VSTIALAATLKGLYFKKLFPAIFAVAYLAASLGVEAEAPEIRAFFSAYHISG